MLDGRLMVCKNVPCRLYPLNSIVTSLNLFQHAIYAINGSCLQCLRANKSPEK